jgi:hypothetical protein
VGAVYPLVVARRSADGRLIALTSSSPDQAWHPIDFPDAATDRDASNSSEGDWNKILEDWLSHKEDRTLALVNENQILLNDYYLPGEVRRYWISEKC